MPSLHQARVSNIHYAKCRGNQFSKQIFVDFSFLDLACAECLETRDSVVKVRMIGCGCLNLPSQDLQPRQRHSFEVTTDEDSHLIFLPLRYTRERPFGSRALVNCIETSLETLLAQLRSFLDIAAPLVIAWRKPFTRDSAGFIPNV